MARRKRMGARVTWATVGLAMIGLVGCSEEPESGDPNAPAVPAKTASAPPAAADAFTIVYTRERLERLGMLKRGLSEREYQALWSAPPEVGRARLEIGPLEFQSGCLPATIPRDAMPVMCKVGFNLASRPQIPDPCVFNVMMGPAGKAHGTFMVSETSIDEIVEAGEPVYAVMSGYVITGGKNPVVRGRRSRAGAPGTWMALKLEGEDPNQESYREVYFLLNTVDVPKRKVRVYLGVPKLPHEGDQGNTCPPKNNETLEITDRDKAILVKGSCVFEVIDLNQPEHAALKLFRDHAAEMARCADLPGNEPVPQDPTSGSTTVSPTKDTPR